MKGRNNSVPDELVYALSGYYAGVALKQSPGLIDGGANFSRLNKLIHLFVEELPAHTTNDINSLSAALNTGADNLVATGEILEVDTVRGVFSESTEELVAGLVGFLIGYNRDIGLGNCISASLADAGYNPSGYNFIQPRVYELVFIIKNCGRLASDRGVFNDLAVPRSDADLHHITAVFLSTVFNTNSFNLDTRRVMNISRVIVDYILMSH